MKILNKKPKVSEEDVLKAEGLSWLIRNAPIQNPVVQDVLVKNIERCSPFIEQLELLIDYKAYKFMIFLKISFLGKLFSSKVKISEKIVKILQGGFPKYAVKIWFKKEEWAKLVESLTN